MRDPDRLRQPEPPQPLRFPEQRESIRGERKHPVERAGDLDPAQRRQQLHRRIPRRHKRLGIEPIGRRLVVGLAMAPDVARVNHHRLVPIAADRIVVPPLPEVEVAILVAKDRLGNLRGRASQLGEGSCPGQLVLDRSKRNRDANHAPDARPPDATAHQNPLRFDPAARRLHRAHAASLDRDANDFGSLVKRRPAGGARQCLSRPDRFGDAVRRDEERAQDLRLRRSGRAWLWSHPV